MNPSTTKQSGSEKSAPLGQDLTILNRRWFVKRALALGATAHAFGFTAWPRLFANSFTDVFGPSYQPATNIQTNSGQGPRQGLDAVRRWNAIALNATGLDHTPVAPGENRVYGEQLGPCRSSRALAIVHIAMFDTVNAVLSQYQSYTGVRAPSCALALQIAISQAAHDTLAALFPSQAATFDARLAEDLGAINNKIAKINSINLGREVATAILALRANDGSQAPEPRVGIDHLTSNLPGHWRQDPISLLPIALGGHWGECLPFVLESSSKFRALPFPALTSPEYALAYNEVKGIGGDGVITPTARIPEQTQIGIFWAYDGTPSLCAPPRLYNQIALLIAGQMGSTDLEVARLLALVNVALAEAGLAIWESKYFYDIWRPITGIRESEPGTGPTGLGDGNASTLGDPTWSPLGAPASNLTGPNFTPPFPAYPSGHAGFGGALFQTLRNFYGTDDISFTFVSDEFDGVTHGNDGNVRPIVSRSFSSLSEAEEENGQSRIYLGIHWTFDKVQGIAQGRRVANHVFANAFTPLYPRGR